MSPFEAFGSALFDRRIRQLQMERDEKNGVRHKQAGGILAMLQDPQFLADLEASASRMALMPKQAEAGGNLPTEEELSTMSWLDLMGLRSSLKSREEQNLVAPYEHRAYARENTGSPLEAAQMGLMSLGYTPFKTFVGKSRSDPSFREISQGLLGTLEGLATSRRK